jgi:hypothetical protein
VKKAAKSAERNEAVRLRGDPTRGMTAFHRSADHSVQAPARLSKQPAPLNPLLRGGRNAVWP